MEEYVQAHYNKIKDFLLLDNFNQAKAEGTSYSRINSKITIGDIDAKPMALSPRIGQSYGVISLVKKETDVPQLLLEINDVPFYKTKQVFNPLATEALAKNLITFLNETYIFIKEHDNVLIHCKRGMSRSSLVYLYYELKDHFIHENNSMPILYELVALLKAKRDRCMIGDEFIFLLCYFQYMFITGGAE